jgi:hypothetical protein
MIDTVVVAPGEASGSSLAIPKKVGRPKGETCPCRTDPYELSSAGRLSMPHEEGKTCNALSYFQL